MLGTTSYGTNYATRMGDLLIESGAYDAVILAPIAVGRSSIEQWLDQHAKRFDAVFDRLRAAGLTPDFILWSQGEGNLAPDSQTQAIYAGNLHRMVRQIRQKEIHAPFIAALTTICGDQPRAGIRAAVKAAVSPQLGIHLGPDTDTLSAEPRWRWDTCHFSEDGIKRVAQMWANAILKFKP